MAQDIQKNLDDFENRISYQESIHKGVIDNPDMVHGLVSNVTVIIIASSFVSLVAISAIFYFSQKK